MATKVLQGGEKLQAKLAEISSQVARGGVLRVGFLEDATYSASDSENFIKRMQDIRRQDAILKATSRQLIAGKNRNVMPALRAASGVRRARMADFGLTTLLHVAQVAFWNEFGTVRSPARPFFRNAIKKHSPEWGSDLVKIIRQNGYNGLKILRLMGTLIRDQIVTSIAEWPADNAPLTVRLKGFNKGLVWSGQMQRDVDYDVKANTSA